MRCEHSRNASTRIAICSSCSRLNEASCYSRRDAHRARWTQRAVHLRGSARAGDESRRISREQRHQAGDRVMLVSSNSPEWGMTYFGVLKAGATCIRAIRKVRLPRFSTSRGRKRCRIDCSEAIINDHPTCKSYFSNRDATPLDVSRSFALPDEQTEDERVALLPQRAHRRVWLH